MVIRLHRRILAAAVLLLTTAILLSWIAAQPVRTVFSPVQMSESIIVLDAGHGGADGGTSGSDGTLESTLNLQIVRRLEWLFLFLGQQTVLTREDEQDLSGPEDHTIGQQKVSDIRARVELVNSLDGAFLISIHQNYLTGHPEVHGAQVFYSQSEEAHQAALAVQDALNLHINPRNEKNCKPAPTEVYLMAHVTAPAILIECGFLSNTQETQLLASADYQKELSAVIAAGYLQYHTKEGTA